MTALVSPVAFVQSRERAATTAHRADVQGLRAVAVLLVALGHAGVGFLAGGFVGVDVFFVLSGFLITGLLLAEARKQGSVSLVEFYVRRARRIIPAAALTLMVTDVASVYVLNFVRARPVVGDGVHAATFMANFRFAGEGVDYFAQNDPPSPLLHYWSLSVEEQFYVVWPLVLVTVLFGLHGVGDARRRTRLLLVVLAAVLLSFLLSVHETHTSPTTAYFSPFTRSWELGLGAVLALAAPVFASVPSRAKLVCGWAGLLGIAAGAVGFSGRTPYPGSAALLPAAGAALAIVAGSGTSRRVSASRLLGARALGVVGDRSYAFYLWHWPALVLVAAYLGHDPSLAVRLVVLAFAFALASASYALVENPIRTHMKTRTATAIVAAACMAGVLATSAASSVALDRQQSRFAGARAAVPAAAFRTARAGAPLPAVIAAVEAARNAAPLPGGLTPPIGSLRTFPARYLPPDGCLAHDRDRVSAARVCRIGRPASRKVLVLLGDSHALMWLPSVLELAWRDNWAVVPLLRLGCTPGRWHNDHSNCGAWYRWALKQVERLRPHDLLVGGSVDQAASSEARRAVAGIATAARALRPYGRVTVIGDPEGLAKDPVDCLLSRGATMATCTTTWPATALSGYDSVAREAAKLDVGFLATREFVCYERRCPSVIGNTIAWMDTNHLTVAYAVQVADAFRTAFVEATRR